MVLSFIRFAVFFLLMFVLMALSGTMILRILWPDVPFNRKFEVAVSSVFSALTCGLFGVLILM